jgi:hypothetical protein
MTRPPRLKTRSDSEDMAGIVRMSKAGEGTLFPSLPTTQSSMAMRGFSPSLENALALDSAARPHRCEAGCCEFGADITTSRGLSVMQC